MVIQPAPPGTGGTAFIALLANIHPSEVRQEEFLTELNLTAYRLAKDPGIPQTRLSQLLRRQRRTTADTALQLLWQLA